MSSVERNLVSKILQTRDLSDIVDGGITPKFFLDDDHRSAFKVILDHQAQYGVVPTEETFRLDYPTYRLSSAGEPTAFYLDELRGHYQDYLVETALVEAYTLFDDEDDTEASLKRLAKLMQEANAATSSARVTDITQTDKTRMERYVAYTKRDGSLRGIPTGFPSLDQATLGWQPGQLNVMVGPPKAGKSTMMLLSAMAAHIYGYVPLFIGFEMTNEEQEERYDSIRAGVSHHKLREGTLSRDDMEKIRRSMAKDRSMPPLIFAEDVGGLTVSGVASYIDKYKPDVVFLDGVYMMDDDHGEKKGSPQALTNITRTSKQLARAHPLPICISTQVLEWKMSKTKGVTTQSIGYSSSFLQDADNLVAVETTDEADVNKMKMLASRNSPGMEWYMQWDWERAKFEELQDPGGVGRTEVTF